MEWLSIGLSSKLSLTCLGNINCRKSVHHPIACGNRKAMMQVYSFLGQTEKERKTFLGGCKKGDCIERLPQEHSLMIIYAKVFCYSLDSLSDKHCKIWSSMINLWINSGPVKSTESCCQQGKGLIIFFMILFHKVLKVIFQK